jgi:hypothetical protein
MATINNVNTAYSISDMESYGRGWSWTLVIEEAGEQQMLMCRTSQDRDGLWVNGRQILGTTQFSLSADKRTAQRQILRYWQTR